MKTTNIKDQHNIALHRKSIVDSIAKESALAVLVIVIAASSLFCFAYTTNK